MFLSQIQLDHDRDKELFGNIGRLHSFVYSGFQAKQTHLDRADPQSSAVLYRLEPTGQLLVQSRSMPSWSVDAQIREFHPSIVNGSVFNFRLKANPTKRDPNGGGRRVAVLDACHLDWLERKAAICGFALMFANVVSVRKYFYDMVVIKAVTYEGFLTVQDAKQFTNALVAGIGSGKAWGCGLLSCAHP